jgi:hypothetical protein
MQQQPSRNKPSGSTPQGSPPPSAGLLLSAVIIGVAVIGGALIIRSALQKTTQEMGEIRLALNDTKQALVAAAQARPAPQRAPSGPDPNRRYTVNTSGAPAKGPGSARVKIVEFSDFQ